MKKTNIELMVLMRASKKTGKIDTVMTGLGDAMMRLWALNNTPTTKMCFIIDKKSYIVNYLIKGSKDGFPKVFEPQLDCEDFGISHEMIDEIKDERFE